MKKYFKKNQSYFRFINQYKDKINVLEIKKLPKSICCIYKYKKL